MELSLVVLVTFSALLCSVPAHQEYGDCSEGKLDYMPVVFRGLYASLNATECELASNTRYKQYDPFDGEIFDYVIIGAGAAGSLLANRLSAISNWKILVLEAGGDPTMTSEIPGVRAFTRRTEIDWQFNTVPEDYIYWGRAPNGSDYWPRGKAVGGSTTLNAMVYTRGTPRDYGSWLAAGNKRWGYKDLLPYFIQFENMTAQEILSCKTCMKYHGTHGELTLESFAGYGLDPYSELVVEGLKTIGFSEYPDYNNPEMLQKGGFYFIQGTKRNQRRCSAAKAFLRPVERRRNLRLSKYSLVSKVLIRNNKAAYGVEFKNRFNQTIRVLTSKEVIVSAGAVSTPQLMMLSGIGPKEQLENLGIDVVRDAPSVGTNLQDHPMFPGIVISFEKELPTTGMTAIDQLFEYLTRSTGFMTSLGTNILFLNSFNVTDDPDIEIIFSHFDKNSPEVAQNFGAFAPEIIKLFTAVNENKPLIFARVILLRPKSKGRVTLKSSDPEEHPNIFSGYFKNEEDFIPIINTVRIFEKLSTIKPMRELGAKLELFDYPKCRIYKPGSDNYWACAVRYLVTTTFHPCCSMKMGPDSDNKAVVDSRLRVKGISKLRAVDMSISPLLVSAHTQSTAYVIAAKAADMIISDAKKNGETLFHVT